MGERARGARARETTNCGSREDLASNRRLCARGDAHPPNAGVGALEKQWLFEEGARLGTARRRVAMKLARVVRQTASEGRARRALETTRVASSRRSPLDGSLVTVPNKNRRRASSARSTRTARPSATTRRASARRRAAETAEAATPSGSARSSTSSLRTSTSRRVVSSLLFVSGFFVFPPSVLK